MVQLLEGQTFAGVKEGKGSRGSGKKPSFLWDNHSGLVMSIKRENCIASHPLWKK